MKAYFERTNRSGVWAIERADETKKVSSSLRTKWQQGKSTASNLPFGYCKDPEAKGKWQVDPEAGKYVRMIFEKANEGWPLSRIVNFLNEQKISTPGKYKEMKKQSIYIRKVTNEE